MRNKYSGELWAIRVVFYMLKHSLTHLIVKFDTKLVLHFLTLTIIAKKKKKKKCQYHQRLLILFFPNSSNSLFDAEPNFSGTLSDWKGAGKTSSSQDITIFAEDNTKSIFLFFFFFSPPSLWSWQASYSAETLLNMTVQFKS